MSVLLGANEVKKVVAYLYSGKPAPNDETLVSEIRPLGTGFFVALITHSNRRIRWTYLVTAKHVLKANQTYRRQIYVRANLKDWNPSSTDEGVDFYRVNVLDQQDKLLWYVHRDPNVDLAVIQNYPPHEFEYKTIPPMAFATKEVLAKEGVAEGDEIFFPCFTPEIPQERRNIPLIRFGRIALMSEENMQTHEGPTMFHIAECFPFGGSSGSPVFLRLGHTRSARDAGQERYFLFGVMKGYFIDRQPLDQVQVSFQSFSRQNMGISLITPVDYLYEILHTESVRKARGETNQQ